MKTHSENKWYSIQAKSADEADVLIYNEIGGWGISAENFVNDLNAITAKKINVRINSPGGSVFDAFAIFNTLKNHKAEIITHIDGFAASAASVIMLAGDEVKIAKNGYIMIHEAASGVWGNAADMRKEAAILEKLNGTIATAYADKTGKPKTEMLAAMAVETWYDAQEAFAAGLVDEITDDAGTIPASAVAALDKFRHTPATLRHFAGVVHKITIGQSDTPSPNGNGAKAANSKEVHMTIEAFNTFAAEHPEAVAKFVNQGKMAGEVEARAQATARAKAIREACGGNDALALDVFLAGKDADDAKLAVMAIASANAANTAVIAAQKKEIDELTARLGTQKAIGTAGGAGKVGDAPNAAENPKAFAEKEWDDNPDMRDSWVSKDVYVRARVKEINAEAAR